MSKRPPTIKLKIMVTLVRVLDRAASKANIALYRKIEQLAQGKNERELEQMLEWIPPSIARFRIHEIIDVLKENKNGNTNQS